jgi:hypothetical protein
VVGDEGDEMLETPGAAIGFRNWIQPARWYSNEHAYGDAALLERS